MGSEPQKSKRKSHPPPGRLRRRPPKLIGASRDVFLNCPFDPDYRAKFLEPAVFTILYAGLVPRCALEEPNTLDRFGKLCRIIRHSAYSLNDLSRVELDAKTGLPRFNMPFELGLFLGCQAFGGARHSRKKCAVFDTELHRHEIFLSDLKGMDFLAHGGDPQRFVVEIRNWLVTSAKMMRLAAGEIIWNRYRRFQKALPGICRRLKKNSGNLTFVEHVEIAASWLEESRKIHR